jgi:hypothetical protein
MTTKSRAAGAVLALLVAGVVPLLAQDEGASRSLVGAVSVQPTAGSEGGPLAVVTEFLSLAPEQVQALVQLLRERQEAVPPILLEIAKREQRIRELIASGGDPAEIGRLVLEIHQLRQLAEAVQAQFLARFQSLLNDAQRTRWQQVRVAAGLQPVLPAFQVLQIL